MISWVSTVNEKMVTMGDQAKLESDTGSRNTHQRGMHTTQVEHLEGAAGPQQNSSHHFGQALSDTTLPGPEGRVLIIPSVLGREVWETLRGGGPEPPPNA